MSKIKVMTGLVSPRASLLGLHMGSLWLIWPFLCGLTSLVCLPAPGWTPILLIKTPPLRFHLILITSLKVWSYWCSHQRLGLPHRTVGDTIRSVTAPHMVISSPGHCSEVIFSRMPSTPTLTPLTPCASFSPDSNSFPLSITCLLFVSSHLGFERARIFIWIVSLRCLWTWKVPVAWYILNKYLFNVDGWQGGRRTPFPIGGHS